MRDTLICTVGTSLISNLRQSHDSRFHKFLQTQNVKGLVIDLLSLSPGEKMCGAEINSIQSIISGQLLKKRKTLVFLVSDTEDGRFTGEVLRLYYENGKNPNRFEDVEYKIVTGLSASDVNQFRNVGLRNLVRRISEVVKRPGESGRVLINSTGGYKAQISFAGMIGQALGIPVCYMYEGFSEVIQLPPQPVSFDLTFWLDYNDLFFDLEEGVETEKKFISPDDRFISLIESEKINGTYLTTLSPTGQLFHDSFRHHFGKTQDEILPAPSQLPVEAKKNRYEDSNSGKHSGLNIFLNKLCSVPYINEIYTFWYSPDLNIPIRFRKSAKGEPDQVEDHFSKTGATTKFIVLTTAKTVQETQACIADLNNNLALGLL